MTIKERLPVPGWTREGETWTVEEETAVDWTTEVYGTCSDKRCEHPAIAGIVRWGEVRNQWCTHHLAESKIWVENGRIVSWRLSLSRRANDQVSR